METELDFAELKAHFELEREIELDLGQPEHSTGRWLFWPCPFHTEKTGSFGVTPETQTYYCFGCGCAGDVITWLREYRKLDMPEIVRLARMDGADRPCVAQAMKRKPASRDDDRLPTAKWQSRARVFVDWAVEQLWNDSGIWARRYLHEQRGLDDDTIRAWRIGANLTCWYDKPVDKWGFTQGQSIYLSRGIIIPCESDGVLWYIQVRRPYYKPDDPSFRDSLLDYIPTGLPKFLPDRKYWAVKPCPGVGRSLYGVQHLAGRETIVLAEGEFDALLLWQEARDLVDVAAVGGAGKAHRGLAGRWLLRLWPYERILAAFDADLAGWEASSAMGETSRRLAAIVVPYSNDICAFHHLGGDVHTWIKMELESNLPLAPHIHP